jgi:hypothetical protein
MEFDHDLELGELAVRVLGLAHMGRLYDEIGCFESVSDELFHAVTILAERVAIEAL